MNRVAIVDLGVAETHAILQRLGVANLPPLAAVENEDWGRDLLLSHFEVITPARLAELGLTRDEHWDRDEATDSA